MTALYRLNRGVPAVLPRLALDAQGRAWTDLANQPPEVLAACSLVEAPPMPAYDPATQLVVWDVGAETWVIQPTPPLIGPFGPLSA
jgi:hypothetical protein